MSVKLHFHPIAASWVAIHPQPKGVVQFIGGAFFGTFPTVCYRYFLSRLFEAGYTIVAFPFRFSFRHWPLAISLLREQQAIQQELIARARPVDASVSFYQNPSNYYWVGHSLGCKYIALLEFLSGEHWQQILSTCAEPEQIQQIEAAIAPQAPQPISIKGQPSLLLAPDISDTKSAIPVAWLARALDRWKLGVLPTRQQTQCLVEQSNLFNLTALISFDQDAIAGSVALSRQHLITENDVLWLLGQLENRKFPLLHQELPGKHLAPLGVQINQWIVDFNPWDKFAERLDHRRLEALTLQFLQTLQQRNQKG